MPTILLVEDDELLRFSCENRLGDAGYKVIAVPDTMTALRALDEGGRIDLALVDVMMPPGQPHGLSFAKLAKVKRADLPVIFMTGRDALLNDQPNLPGPVFKKPVDWAKLMAEIETQLNAPDEGSGTRFIAHRS
jgi:DNA-binding response OmpR family regulator